MLWDVPWRTNMDANYFISNLFNRLGNDDSLRSITVDNDYYNMTQYYESTVLLPLNYNETTVIFCLFF